MAPALRSRFVFSTLDRSPHGISVPGMAVVDQIAFEPNRTLTPACDAELETAQSNGADFARYLARNATDGEGRLGGNVVFARDFGERNALLRDRFGARAWYRARIARENGALRALIEPLSH